MLTDNNGGFTLMEAVVVFIIISVLAAISIPEIIKYRKQYVFNSYGSQMDYLVKYGKIYAMQKTTNVGICVSGSVFSVRDIGTSRSAAACGGTVLKTMEIKTDDSYVTVAGSGASFDPRGLAINQGWSCVEYGNKHIKSCISRTGIRKEEGTGVCAACSS